MREDEIKKEIRALCKKNRYKEAKIVKDKYKYINIGWIKKLKMHVA